jgi:hypothetical protein
MAKKENKCRFKDIPVGSSFDFINDEKPMFTSFYLRCVKTGTRKYIDEGGTGHTVGSVNAEVFHVRKLA